MAQNVTVMVRVRPMLKFESEPIWIIRNNSLDTITNTSRSQRHSSSDKKSSRHNKQTQYHFNFENIITEGITSQNIYKKQIKPVLIESYHSCRNLSIIAYGQTCSGKTHTILGVKQAPGIIPCVLRELFSIKKQQKCQIKISYLEIYNEKLSDLLDKKQKQLKIVEDSKWGCEVTGSSRQIINNFQEAVKALQKGQKQRQYGQGQYHQRSSRSHTLLRIFVEGWDHNLTSKSFIITIVDLAGSQRLTNPQQSSIQAGYINKSLFQLSNCISKLSDKSTHIPFRDSKLTKLLEPSFVGEGRSLLICCISPSDNCFGQTLSTLKFAQKAKNIMLKSVQEPVFNNQLEKLSQKLKQKNKECLQLKREIERLNKKIQKLQHQNLNKADEVVKANLLILLDHQNFTLFLKDTCQQYVIGIKQFQQQKDCFLTKMQLIYQEYTKQILKNCYGDKFQLQIQEVCFMNMVLDHEKIIQYKLEIIQQLLQQKQDKKIEDNLVFYKALEKYRQKIAQKYNISSKMSSNFVYSYKNSSSKSNREYGYYTEQAIDSQRLISIHQSPSLQLDQPKMEEQFGTEVLVWGCKKDYRVCKGAANGLGMVRINNIGQIKTVICGYNHTLIITKEGNLYGWGKNSEKQIVNSNKQNISHPTLIPGIRSVKSAAAGWGHSLVLTAQGQVYSWGYGKDGQLGLKNQQNSATPQIIQHQNEVICVYAGHSHSAFLDDSGNLFTFGFNQDYRLMIGDQKKVLSPKKILIRDVLTASLGVSHSAIVTISGFLYCGGVGTNGQLGVQLNQNMQGWQKLQVLSRKFQEETYQKICPLVQVQGFNTQYKAVRVQCGENMTVVLTENGDLYTFGKTLSGRLGHSKSTPTKILEKVDLIAAGSRHGLAYRNSDMKLYTWGFNLYGQSNPTISEDIEQPILFQNIDQKPIIGLSSGFFHTAILLQ